MDRCALASSANSGQLCRAVKAARPPPIEGYLPHEALIIYREKIYAERKARSSTVMHLMLSSPPRVVAWQAYQTPSGAKWFKDLRICVP